MSLTTLQRIALRQLSDDKGDKIHGRTIASLVRRGLVTQDGSALTEAGRRTHRQVMSSGDGPEYLKGLFRF